ncbi:MAG: hypothetical protein IMZ46_02375 [Acidobacteria bacterium]|nr:hypothetical protein [Acidobacteriota bacterium]
MTIKEIVEKYLRENGYEGLAGEDCGCTLDDLFPCDGNSDGSTGVEKCEPAMKGKCPGADECEWAEVPEHAHMVPGPGGVA